MANGSKQCPLCGETKPQDLFGVDRSRKDGRSHRCRACDNTRSKEYYNRKHRAARETQTCARCGEPFGGRRRKYCGRCAPPWIRRSPRSCQTCGDDVTPRSRYPTCKKCSSAECEACGEVFRLRINKGVPQRTCSRKCGLIARYGQREAKAIPIPWACCAMCHSVFIARANRTRCPDCPQSVRRPKTEHECTECGEVFLGRAGSKYCGVRCSRRARNRHRRHQGRVALRLVKVNADNRGPRPKQANCAECGEHLVGQQRKWCGVACRDRAYERHDRHLARLVAPSDEPVFTIHEIAMRDGWRCHICRKRVKAEHATFDHLVPIVDGGLHEPSNVALAHHRCNSLRGARGTAQLLLAV